MVSSSSVSAFPSKRESTTVRDSWLRFCESAIEDTVPDAPGVYGIADGQGDIIYVGQSDDLRRRLLQHVRRQSDQAICIFSNAPCDCVYRLVPGGDTARKAEEDALINEYDPPCNR